MKSLRCVCGHVLSADTREGLLQEVESHLSQMLTHAQLLGAERVAQLDDDAPQPSVLACDGNQTEVQR